MRKKRGINEEFSRAYKGVEPQVAPNRISNLDEKDTRRVYDPKTFNSGDVLLEDKSCIGASVQELLAVSKRRSWVLVKMGVKIT
jgi:hypothetical protein